MYKVVYSLTNTVYAPVITFLIIFFYPKFGLNLTRESNDDRSKKIMNVNDKVVTDDIEVRDVMAKSNDNRSKKSNDKVVTYAVLVNSNFELHDKTVKKREW